MGTNRHAIVKSDRAQKTALNLDVPFPYLWSVVGLSAKANLEITSSPHCSWDLLPDRGNCQIARIAVQRCSARYPATSIGAPSGGRTIATAFVVPRSPDPVLSPTFHFGGRPARNRLPPVLLSINHSVSRALDDGKSASPSTNFRRSESIATGVVVSRTLPGSTSFKSDSMRSSRVIPSPSMRANAVSPADRSKQLSTRFTPHLICFQIHPHAQSSIPFPLRSFSVLLVSCCAVSRASKSSYAPCYRWFFALAQYGRAHFLRQYFFGPQDTDSDAESNTHSFGHRHGRGQPGHG
jgi:hypothetical protein